MATQVPNQRLRLSGMLHDICGSNVYFQPPSNKKLEYPCIVYNLSNLNVVFADNGTYRMMDEYSITYITRDPDDVNIRRIATLPYCSLTRTAPSDNLHHSYYRIFV